MEERPKIAEPQEDARLGHERSEEITRAHALAMLKVSQRLTQEETSSLKNFLTTFKHDYRRRMQPTTNLQEISDILLSDKKIEYGKYKLLKDFCGNVGRRDLVNALSAAEKEIAKISQSRKHGEKDQNLSRILQYHAELHFDLDQMITPGHGKALKRYFMDINGEMDELNGFGEMWDELIRRGEISPGRYDVLRTALKSIQATSLLQVLNEFDEKIKSEDGRYDGWTRQDIVVKSVEELMEKKEDDFRRILEKGDPGVLFKNAAIGNIGEEGGELRLTNGSVHLDVPSGAVDGKTLFWIFVGQDGCPQFYVRPANGPVTDSNIIAKYSIPVRLGPTDIRFSGPVRLKVKDFSRPPSKNGFSKSMSVYCKLDGETEWKTVGSCFYESDSNNDLRASVSLNHFSSYVLGMTVSSDLLPLNVRVMLQSRPVKVDAESAENVLQVYFTVNDYSFSQELVLHNLINVDSVTCLYLDPKHDASVSWVKRHSVQKSVRCINTEILHKEHIQILPDTPVSLKVAAIDGSGSADMIETESEFEDILILEQNGTVLVELPLAESASAVTTSAGHPTDCPEQTNQVADLSKRLIRATLSGNKNEVQRLLNEGANIETRDIDENTIMSLASSRGSLDLSSTRSMGRPVNNAQELLNKEVAKIVDNGLDERQFNAFKEYIKGSHGILATRPTDNAKEVAQLIGLLRNAKKIEVGAPNGYQLLIDILIKLGECVLADKVKEFQAKIVEAGPQNPTLLPVAPQLTHHKAGD